MKNEEDFIANTFVVITSLIIIIFLIIALW